VQSHRWVDGHDENFALPKDVDLAFITIHGTFGEDGQLQKILEERGVAYTGDGVEASRAAFDKILSKEKFREHKRHHSGMGKSVESASAQRFRFRS